MSNTTYSNITGANLNSSITSLGSGGYYTTGNATTVSITGSGIIGGWSSTATNNLRMGENPVITTSKGTLDVNRLIALMARMEEVLMVISEDQSRHEKYPALKEIFDQYRVVQALIDSDEDDAE